MTNIQTINKRLPNYMTKILQAYASGQFALRPGVFRLDVSHDDDCAIFDGGVCNCNPDINLVNTDGQQELPKKDE